MRRTRFMTWSFLVLSLAFFLVRDFRFALEAPLANYWYTTRFSLASLLEGPPKPSHLERLYTLKRYASSEKLQALAEEAARRGDSNFVAFAALNLPPKKNVLELADKAVEGDANLTWIYLPLVLRLSSPAPGEEAAEVQRDALQRRIQRLETFDPENAAPHLLNAQLIRVSRGKAWPSGPTASSEFLNALARESEWGKEMEAAFASPRYDTYNVREFELTRRILRERGWDHPVVMVTVRGLAYEIALLDVRNYTNLLVLKFGTEAEASGRLKEALGYYWQAAQFGNRMRLQSSNLIQQLMAQACQLIAYRRLAPALRKAGEEEQARMLEILDNQILRDMRRLRAPLARTSNYEWSVLLVNLCAGLVAVFFLNTMAVVLYVNAKLWIRKEKKGRLYETLTTAENYLPILLFLSCGALYLSFAPFGRNYAYYLTTEERVEVLPETLFANIYPLWTSYPGGELGIQNPFEDYVPFALAGIVLLTTAFVFSRWRESRTAPALAGPWLATPLQQVNVAVYLFLAVTGAAVVAMLRPWEASLVLEGVVGLIVGAMLWTSSSYAKRPQAPEKSSWRVKANEAAAYLILLLMAVVSGVAVALLAFTLKGPHKPDRDDWALLLVLSPVVVGGIVGAARMRFRRITLVSFALIALGLGSWITYDEFASLKKSRTTSPATPQAQEGLSKFAILMHAASGRPDSIVGTEVMKHGLNFPPDMMTLGIMREAGTGEALLKVLRTARWKRPAPGTYKEEFINENKGLSNAVSSHPKNAALHFALGYFREEHGAEGEAIVEYRKALRLKPDFSGAHRGLGRALMATGKMDAAISEFRQALRLDPDNALTHFNLGEALAERHDVDGAIRELRQVVRLEPREGRWHSFLGKWLDYKGNLDEAISEFREAVRLQPGVPIHHVELGAALRKKGDFEGAIVEYREALRYYRDWAEAHCGLGAALASRGDIEGATREFREALRLNPEFTDAHNNLGLALERKGNLEGAIAEFREAIRLDPKSAEAHKNLGAALEKKGDLRASLEQFRAASRLNPKNSDFRENYRRLSQRLAQDR